MADSKKYPYLEYCKKQSFILSKVVHPKSGADHMATIQNAKQKIEIDFGAKMGARPTRDFLEEKGFKDNTPLGACQLVLNEDVCLHHKWVYDPKKVNDSKKANDPNEEDGRKWLDLYEKYAAAVKYGVLIIAVKPEYFQAWAKSSPCLKEVSNIPDGRLFAYIEHTDGDEGGKQGYIVSIQAQAKTGSATVANGKGYVLFENGEYYHGDLKKGKRNGHGKNTYADGSKYEGEWKDDKSHGRGTYTYADGDKYEGEYKDNKRHGRGIFTYASGSKYEGEWKDNEMHGRGIYTYANGNKYEGEWKDGEKHGRGIYTYANGDKYEGEWKDDKRHGRGTYTYANGNKKRQEYKNGKKCP